MRAGVEMTGVEPQPQVAVRLHWYDTGGSRVVVVVGVGGPSGQLFTTDRIQS